MKTNHYIQEAEEIIAGTGIQVLQSTKAEQPVATTEEIWQHNAEFSPAGITREEAKEAMKLCM